jgi:hypothetical protein
MRIDLHTACGREGKVELLTSTEGRQQPGASPHTGFVRYDAQRGDWQRHSGRNDGYRRYKSGEREIGSAEGAGASTGGNA